MKLELFYKTTCPYCKKVINYLNKNKVEITLKETSIEKNASYLIEHGGKKQVPCLFVNKKPLYESDDILTYLRKHSKK